jgi:hypothetical protein
MSKVNVKSAVFLALFPLLFSASASAQATRTWVSGVGDDANPCSRTAPCKTFAGAISKTSAGGEINALDPGGFGGVTITKAITIANEGVGEAGVLVSATNGITVNAGPNDVVVLRGLVFEGLGATGNSLNGVKFNTGATLIIQNCMMRDFAGASPNGYGIAFTPSAVSSLFVSDSSMTGNGNAAGPTGGGVLIQPTGSGSAKASLNRIDVANNIAGIRADGTGSTGGISVSISDSTVTANAYSGITATTPAGGSSIAMEIMRSNSTNNGIGLNAHGAGTTMRVGYSSVTGNATGINVVSGALGTSLGNNLVFDNATAGETLTIAAPQ